MAFGKGKDQPAGMAERNPYVTEDEIKVLRSTESGMSEFHFNVYSLNEQRRMNDLLERQTGLLAQQVELLTELTKREK